MGIKTKVVFGFIGIIIVILLLQLAGIGWFRVIEPMREDARREVFEETKSYVHGKIQQLAKYKYEYDRSEDPLSRGGIKSVIRSQFAAFDADNIRDYKLKNFLIKIRGF